MTPVPNILNNLLANLRTKHFKGSFRSASESLGIGATYLKKIENGAISQPNEEYIKKLAAAYGEHWGMIIDTMAKAVQNKKYFEDSPRVANYALFRLLELLPIASKTIVCSDCTMPATPLIKNTCRYNCQLTFLLSIEYLQKNTHKPFLKECLTADRVSLFTEKQAEGQRPLASNSVCFDDVLLAELYPSFYLLTANQHDVRTWLAKYTNLKDRCMSLSERVTRLKTLDSSTDDYEPHHDDFSEEGGLHMQETFNQKEPTSLD